MIWSACHSAGVAVSTHVCFTWIHAVAYWHQKPVFGGRHASGPWSLFERLAEPLTAMRCSE
jgi:hypothetical protein